MFVIIGAIIVIASVLGGFMWEGGKPMLLFQPAEFVIIIGAMAGALMISAPASLLKKVISSVMATLKPSKYTKKFYLNTLTLLHDLFQTARVGGLLVLEEHIEKPEDSAIMGKFPEILHHKDILLFITDTLRLLTVGTGGGELELIMDSDAESQHHENSKPASLVQTIGDSLPGMGIVAAVLGIVVTMMHINGPPEEIGHKVAAALVGTFLGILCAYGFVNPVAVNMGTLNDQHNSVYMVIKAGISAFANGMHPLYAIEFARRSIPLEFRPTFQEMEETIKASKAEAGGGNGGTE